LILLSFKQISTLIYITHRYILGGILLCFSPKQEPLCKKDTAEAKPAAAKDEAEKEEEKPVDDVEAGAATAEGGVKAQVY
jgi:hypothetical protein